MKREITAALAVLSFALFGASAQAEYLAHALGKGSRLPLPESIAGIDARYLVELHWGYRGGRSVVVVEPVVDASGAAAPDAQADAGVPLETIRAMVAATLGRTGRFEVDGDSADGDRLHVTVSTYESGVTARVINPRARRAQGPQVGNGRVVLHMRLVGPAGDVKFVNQFEAVVEKPRAEIADGRPGDARRTAIGQATLAAVNKGVYEIVKAAGPLPISGRVVRAEEGRLWVNLGGGVVAVGDGLEVTTQGETLVDPETGLDLGGVETTVANARVVQVEARFSIAEMTSAAGVPTRGDHVRLTQGSPTFEFAPDWDPPGPDAF